jgi:PAS domain-containing protein
MLYAREYAMALLQSIADRDDVTIVCNKPFPAYTGLDVLLARIHADGRFELLSAAWEKALGFDCAELNGRSLFALLSIDEGSARALLRRVTDPAEPEPLVFDVRCKGGEILRMRWNRRFDQYADAVYVAGQRDGSGNQSSEKERTKASDSPFNAV